MLHQVDRGDAPDQPNERDQGDDRSAGEPRLNDGRRKPVPAHPYQAGTDGPDEKTVFIRAAACPGRRKRGERRSEHGNEHRSTANGHGMYPEIAAARAGS